MTPRTWARTAVTATTGLALLAVAGCDSPDVAGATRTVVSVEDSAGVAIVTVPHEATAELPTWTVADEPTLTIGRLDGEPAYLFGSIGPAVLLPSGGVAVADAQANEVRIFDAGGVWRRTLGREGEGPLEFAQIGGLWLGDDDRLAAVDTRHRKVVEFDLASDTAEARSAGSELCPAAARPFTCRVAGVLANGDFVVSHAVGPAEPSASEPGLNERPGDRVAMAVVRGETRLELGEASGASFSVWSYDDGWIWFFETPFRPGETLATGHDRVAKAAPAAREIRIWSAAGVLERVVRLHLEAPLPRSRLIDRMHAWADTGSSPYPVADYLDAARFDEVVPAFSAVRFDREDRLWMQPYTVSEELGPAPDLPWLVLDPEGLPLAWARGLPGDDLLDVGSDGVLVRSESIAGAPQVRLLPIRR